MHAHGHTFQMIRADGSPGAGQKHTVVALRKHLRRADCRQPLWLDHHCDTVFRRHTGMMTSLNYTVRSDESQRAPIISLHRTWSVQHPVQRRSSPNPVRGDGEMARTRYEIDAGRDVTSMSLGTATPCDRRPGNGLPRFNALRPNQTMRDGRGRLGELYVWLITARLNRSPYIRHVTRSSSATLIESLIHEMSCQGLEPCAGRLSGIPGQVDRFSSGQLPERLSRPRQPIFSSRLSDPTPPG